MSFNSDRATQAQKFLFFRKANDRILQTFYFYEATAKLKHDQRHFSLQLASKLSFNEDTNNKVSNATKDIGLLYKFIS